MRYNKRRSYGGTFLPAMRVPFYAYLLVEKHDEVKFDEVLKWLVVWLKMKEPQGTEVLYTVPGSRKDEIIEEAEFYGIHVEEL